MVRSYIMQELILHSFRRCPFAIRVRMVLEEKKLSYLLREESLSQPSEDLLRLHPEGKVPLLVHRGFAIPESAIITEYLEEEFPNPSLLSSKPEMKVKMRLWTHWCNNILKPDLDLFKYSLEGLSEEKKSSLLIRIQSHLEKLEAQLELHPYLLGQEFSLADIHVFPFYRQLAASRPEFHSLFKAVNSDLWLARITERPSFDRVMRKIP